MDSSFYNVLPSFSFRRRSVKLSFIAKYSPLLTPNGSWARVSVPMWRIPLSRPLGVLGLVSQYLTNYLAHTDSSCGNARLHRRTPLLVVATPTDTFFRTDVGACRYAKVYLAFVTL